MKASGWVPEWLLIGFLWPGGNRGVEYHAARGRTGAAGERMLDWLQHMSSASSIDVMTNSMGSRVFFRGLCSGLPIGANPVRHHFATASAVDNESIENGERFYVSTWTANTDKTWVFHSKRDKVLKIAYKIGDLDTALGYSGPDDPASIGRHSKNVRVINCRKHIGSHGHYKTSDPFFQFIGKILGDQLPKSRQYYTL